jgi:hypothetical protein
MTNREMARYRAAQETLQTAWLDENTLQLDAAFACPDFTLTLAVTRPVEWVELAAPQGSLVPMPRAPTGAGLMAHGTWQADGERFTVCFDLQRGVQTLKF